MLIFFKSAVLLSKIILKRSNLVNVNVIKWIIPFKLFRVVQSYTPPPGF